MKSYSYWRSRIYRQSYGGSAFGKRYKVIVIDNLVGGHKKNIQKHIKNKNFFKNCIRKKLKTQDYLKM